MKKLTTAQLRKLYLDFFASRGHRLVKSDSLVPANDPSVLFTSAGMNQFKDHFLGRVKDFSRAASCQKCLRTGDLDQVGQTPFHHTFFEMLGNFSFGDYFKREAIEWAWEFVTQALEIAPDKLWVSVYEDDAEAFDLWRRHIGLPPEKIKKFGPKDNFWPSNAIVDGPCGPCGPCSEIYFQKPDGASVEVWNLVFTQFDRREGGRLEPLPTKNIDTGMGLERMSSVLQGVDSNFKIDIFLPIVASVKKSSGICDERGLHRIADHARAVTFCIADGALPSNEGRGYVVRKLIRRCLHIAQREHHGPFLYQIVSSIAESMGGQYPEILDRRESIAGVIKAEEEKYIRNILEGGASRTDASIAGVLESGAKEFPAHGAVDLYVTFGVPVDFIKERCEQKGLTLDMEAVGKLIAGEQERSRSSSKMFSSIFSVDQVVLKPSEFVGYEMDSCLARIAQIIKDGREVDEARIGEDVWIILDKTPFYGESGGQVGDRGEFILKGADFKVAIEDAKKEDGTIVHLGRILGPAGTGRECLRVGDAVEAVVDGGHREGTRRAHTATHILQAALKKVLGPHVQQAGSLVEPDRLRFDFTHFKEIGKKEVEDIQDFLQELVLKNDPVQAQAMSKVDAQKTGALALFGEKYAETVRVVSVGNYSKEFCGGTHLDATGKIGPVLILSESSVGSSLRRIEAVTGALAYEKIKLAFEMIGDVSSRLKTSPPQLAAAVDQQLARQKAMEKELMRLREGALESAISVLASGARHVRDFSLVTHVFQGYDTGLLRRAVDLLKKKITSKGIFCLSSVREGNAFFVCGMTSDLLEHGFSAEAMMKEILVPIGGSGGGRKDFAQGGTKDIAKMDWVFQEVERLISARKE